LAAKSIRQAVHDSKLDHSIMKHDASSRKGNSGAAKAEARLKLPGGERCNFNCRDFWPGIAAKSPLLGRAMGIFANGVMMK
jgi:hypothetical protein